MGTPSSIGTKYSGSSEIENNTESMKSDSSPDVMKQISSSRLRTCFEDIVKRIKVVFNLNTLEYILADLKINTKQLDVTLQQIIPYMLVSYIKSWPGWSYQKAMTELKSESQPEEINACLQRCVEIQCQSEDLVGIKAFSAFSIDIEGPPKLLNTLIFGDQQNDIVMKMHAIKGWTSELCIQNLVNWPFIEIEFTSPFMKFTRKIVPNYIRYLSRADTPTKFAKQDFIETVQVNPEVSRTLYSRKFLKKYLLAYSLFLKSKNFSADKITEITVIFSQLIRDIEELGSVCQNGIYDSTTISFNIGGCRYLRNKKTAGVR
ncbi:hypothetical protein WA026_000572 [Henosepilachna vigintioctopunctata]|uniref:Uncharacterized protein n=1 Tax=Henosepilachna vigintioctopunctata TaxID=420089 RepID=A0AAW1UY02_9CUCU